MRLIRINGAGVICEDLITDHIPGGALEPDQVDIAEDDSAALVGRKYDKGKKSFSEPLVLAEAPELTGKNREMRRLRKMTTNEKLDYLVRKGAGK